MKKGGFIILILGALGVFFYKTTLAVKQSSSVPYSYFLILKGMEAKKGEFVSFKNHRPSYVPSSLPLIKRLVGVAGDPIEIKGSQCFVAGIKVGSLRQKTKQGQTLLFDPRELWYII
jgi:type IV secretory pathway protease TraF